MVGDIFIYVNEHVGTSLFINDVTDFFSQSDNNFPVLEDFFNFYGVIHNITTTNMIYFKV